ncbi:UDP-N-acetylmuramoyl-L-alanyl-D-glutamate--2,6-diaminopimelate ligase [Neptunomonas antarctica]|uniref:UDP-N-acetylmuramoyl-L-alanyl-D-glutamate--2,6-diaminopimelate ligase n=1 Tax=Neptunomonas antarctica TaxID=619304 RepID=A0A1N7PFM0_9GAMM|nr:UDP-N-acetylmuramoyl-L-alanyl-D-glutamate--2,6-diaminopimelate ligase [Neptunomonas antarctica]SIT09433.1 UDP-N-acetylmuramoylalanyl-D-glutamate--2,6-diaminopimelate ligase [Neptunomonas antarctica]
MIKFMPTTLQALSIVAPDHAAANCKVMGLSSDSRHVQPGDLFVARDGITHRGVDFIEQAVDAGAIAAVVEAWTTSQDDLSCFGIPVIRIENLADKAGVFAAAMLGQPSTKMTLIGVTGTNGKTSCAHYIAQALTALGTKTALIGTVGNGFPDALNTATHTTPDAITVQRLLSDFYAQGAQAVVMEVSSHALDQGRVSGVQFDVVALTNLSRDHLDYHGSMDAYAEAKSLLFTTKNVAIGVVHKKRNIVLNADDDFGRQLARQLTAGNVPFCLFSSDLNNTQLTNTELNSGVLKQADVAVNQCVLSRLGVQLSLTIPGGRVRFEAPVVGDFNVSNLLLTVSVLSQLDLSAAQIEMAMAQVSAVPGRMECLTCAGRPAVVIDYAHTPDALEKALLAARKHCSQQLWIVFGCGGDRDTGKRAEMAAIAEQFADRVVVTSDNPRTESPDAIIEMIMRGFNRPGQVVTLADRYEAINMAMQQASAEDLVLVAGKGHEDYQEIMGVKYPFSDKVVVESLLGDVDA